MLLIGGMYNEKEKADIPSDLQLEGFISWLSKIVNTV